MRGLNGFRAASVLLFYYILLMIFPVVLPLSNMLLTVLFLSLCCAAAGIWQDNPLHFAFALLPPLVLLFPYGKNGWIYAAVPIVLTELMIVTPLIRTTVWRYANFCKVLIPLIWVASLIGAERKGKAVIILVLGLLDFVSAVFTMRQLRMGSNARLKDRAADAAAILSIPLFAGAVALILRAGLQVIGIFVTVITSVVGWIMRTVVQIFTEIPFNPKNLAVRETTKATEATVEEILETAAQDASAENWRNLHIPVGFYFFLGVLAVVVLLLYFGRSYLRYADRSSDEEDGEWLEADDLEAAVMETPKQIASNRRQIRKIYSRFLRLSEDKGYYVRRTDTSQDVLDGVSGQFDDTAAGELRRIYILARYHSGRRITSQDVAEAKRLYQKLKEQTLNKPAR